MFIYTLFHMFDKIVEDLHTSLKCLSLLSLLKNENVQVKIPLSHKVLKYFFLW